VINVGPGWRMARAVLILPFVEALLQWPNPERRFDSTPNKLKSRAHISSCQQLVNNAPTKKNVVEHATQVTQPPDNSYNAVLPLIPLPSNTRHEIERNATTQLITEFG
jgi:hypothetical protein